MQPRYQCAMYATDAQWLFCAAMPATQSLLPTNAGLALLAVTMSRVPEGGDYTDGPRRHCRWQCNWGCLAESDAVNGRASRALAVLSFNALLSH